MTLSYRRRKPGIYLRISHMGTRRYIALGIKVEGHQWSKAKTRVTSAHPDHARLNRFLHETMTKANSALVALQTADVVLNADRAREAIAEALRPEQSGTPVMNFMHEHLATYKRAGKHGTHHTYRSNIRKFGDFLEHRFGTRNCAFHQLTAELFRDFVTFCYEVKGNAPNTVGKAQQVVGTFLRAAMRAGHLDSFPMKHVDRESEPVQKELVTPGDIETLARASLDPDGKHAEARRWFLFSYYTGGMRFSDVINLRHEHITKSHVKYRMKKTDDIIGVPLSAKARAILEYYDGAFTSNRYVFPIYEEKHLRTEEAMWRRKKYMNQKANQRLNQIAEDTSLSKHVSFHLARNAALWRLYRALGDIYKVSKIAGHSSVQQTEAYLRGFVDDTMLDGAMDAL